MTTVAPASSARRSRPRPSAASSAAIAAGAIATLAVLAAAVLSAIPGGPDQAPGEQFVAWTDLSLLGGSALVATACLVGVRHPTASVGLSLVSLAWLLPRLSTWTSLPPRAQVVLIAAPPLAIAGSPLLAAGWSRAWKTPRLGWSAAGLATAAMIVEILGYDPFFDPHCQFSCTASPAPLATLISAHATITAVTMLALAAAAAAVIVALTCTGPAVVRGGAAAAAVLVSLAAADRWLSWGHSGPPASADRLQALGTAAAALSAAAALVHAHTVARRVRRVVHQLAAPGLVGRSSAVVRDLHFAVSAGDRWVDSTGQEIPDSACDQCAVLANPEGPSVHLVLRRWERADQVLAAVTPAARLALENARLQAGGLVRLAELRASQRRIVEAADLERQRIERDLHDGAQQPLVAVRMHLGSARTRSAGPVPVNLSTAEAHVRAALVALRSLSHDSLGSGLVAEGLVAAVEELLAATPARIDLLAEIDERHFSTAAAMTAYLAIAEGCKNLTTHSGGEHAQVTLLEDEGGLSLQVLDDGRGGAVLGRGLTEIADRVGALAGNFAIDSPLGKGTRLTVWLPCES